MQRNSNIYKVFANIIVEKREKSTILETVKGFDSQHRIIIMEE